MQIFTALAWLSLAGFGFVLSVVDLREFRLPNKLVLGLFLSLVVVLGLDALVNDKADSYWRALVAGLVLMGFYFLLHVVSRGGMGMGDVKLAAALGVIMGYYGWDHVIVGTTIAFFSGAFLGVVLMVLGKAGRKTALPFGPFMIVGALLTLWSTQALWEWGVRTLGY